MPKVVIPEKSTLVSKAPTDKNWLHEIKFDGYRLIAFINGSDVKLISRNNLNWTKHFPNIIRELTSIYTNQNIIFDGEIVLLDDNNRSNFQLLQNSLKENKFVHFIYYVFDLIYYDQYNLMSLPLIERKKLLEKIIPRRNYSIRYSDHIIGQGDLVLKNACKMGLEGIISKNIHSHYQEKRTKDWLKLKCAKRQEFVIGGYTTPRGSRQYFGSLYLGYYDNKKRLIYCGNVGTGFSQQSLKDIYLKLKKSKINKNPFDRKPPGFTSAIWVKPILIAEIEFIEFTDEGILRHPSFKGLREDKKAKQVSLEKPKSSKQITARFKKQK